MTRNRSESRPNFFIVGAPKSGTTAMNAYLKAHPEIFVPEFKEIHYFGSDLHFFSGPKRQLNRRKSIGLEDDYLEYFESARGQTAVGESSVFYLYSTVAAAEIFDFEPCARIIMMLRNPLDALPSYHAQLLYNSDEVHRSLESALDAEASRRAGREVPRTAVGTFKLLYSKIFAYSRQVERYLNIFPKKQVLITLYDDFAAAPHIEYRKALSLLGVDTDFRPEFEVINRGKETRHRWISTFVRRPPPWAHSFAKLFPVSWSRAARDEIVRLNTRHHPRPPVEPHIRKRLRDMFEPDVRRLEGIIDRDLGHWIPK